MWILQVDQVSSQIFLMMEKKQKRKVSEKNGILKKLRDKKWVLVLRMKKVGESQGTQIASRS